MFIRIQNKKTVIVYALFSMLIMQQNCRAEESINIADYYQGKNIFAKLNYQSKTTNKQIVSKQQKSGVEESINNLSISQVLLTEKQQQTVIMKKDNINMLGNTLLLSNIKTTQEKRNMLQSLTIEAILNNIKTENTSNKINFYKKVAK